MKMNNIGTWSGAMLVVGSLFLISEPVKAGSITLINDNFSSVTPYNYESVNYQTQQGLAGTLDSYFSTIDGTNVDVLGNESPVLDEGPTYNLEPFEGICAAADATADCIDLDGTNGISQATLQSTVDITTAGTVVLSTDILGTSGYLNPSVTLRNISTSTTIVFGNSTCIAAPSAINCLYYNDLTLSDTQVDNDVSSALAVTAGTYYVEYISNTAGDMGSLLAGVNLTEATAADPAPEPGTLILLGSALLGLGGVRRFRARR